MASEVAAIGTLVIRDLTTGAEEMAGPEDAMVSWALAQPDGDPALEAFAGFVDCLCWQAVATLHREAA